MYSRLAHHHPRYKAGSQAVRQQQAHSLGKRLQRPGGYAQSLENLPTHTYADYPKYHQVTGDPSSSAPPARKAPHGESLPNTGYDQHCVSDRHVNVHPESVKASPTNSGQRPRLQCAHRVNLVARPFRCDFRDHASPQRPPGQGTPMASSAYPHRVRTQGGSAFQSKRAR